ncbi:hypothetical protein ES332_A01G057000v1 [Gossypium tomentosum]|uniref:Protein kinase domain-containing protein n=1 Tax=Gossypium tomentosum TaxID=34277 RepID=A0A5D2RN01_GOSTO|nr:hypothetical protein ES332_A01G057000v1 [Gossypium tomentosum]
MATPKLALFWLLLQLLALAFSFFPQACTARSINKPCGFTFCGNLNISYPFRLKTQPRSCGRKMFELVCDNNCTIFPMEHGSFYVQHIFYDNQTIHIVDVNVDSHNNCSIPLSSLPSEFGFDTSTYGEMFVMNCSMKINKSWCGTNYINASRCSSFPPTNNNYLYFLDGGTVPSAFHPSCTVEALVPIGLHNIGGLSTFDIYQKLMMGVPISWSFNHDPQDWSSVVNVEGIILARILLGISCLTVLIIHKLKRRHLSVDDSIENFLQSQINFIPIRYSYTELKRITRGFKDKLGQGGFGTVFKGKLRSGKFVAVKLLKESKGNDQDFINEVATIGRIHHVNVVEIVGFCVEGKKTSSYKFIFSTGSSSLSWQKMLEIAIGVGRGIEYLHNGCAMKILHFDIKPHNIPLDGNFNPKLSDFGLAKLHSVDDSIISLTTARGTLGYMAPELFYKNLGGISYKADIYSFGMMLIEIVRRRKNLNAFADNSSQIYFPSWIYHQFELGENLELENMTENVNKIVRKMIIVAFWCIQTKPIHRPTMTKVLKMLESEEELLEIPPKSFLFCVDMSGNGNDNDN